MTVKPISRMIRISPPPSAGWTMSLSSMPGDRHPRAGQPDQHHHPARHQHDGAVVALDAEIDDQADADDRGAGEGEPGDAGGDRRVEHGDAGDQDQAGDPDAARRS